MQTINDVIHKAGSQTKLARLLNITPQCVNKWASGQRLVPVNRAIEISKIFPDVGYQSLRPDVFGVAEDDKPESRAA